MKRAAIISLALITCGYIVLRTEPYDDADSEFSNVNNGLMPRAVTPQDPTSFSLAAPARDYAQGSSELEHSNQSVADSEPLSVQPDSEDSAEDVIIIGGYLDPDDSTVFGREEREPINVGVFLDADNAAAWPKAPEKDPISIGDALSPDSPAYEGRSDSKETISLGLPLDVEAYLMGGGTVSDRQVIEIGEKIEVPPEG